MSSISQTGGSNGMIWTGRVLSALPVLMMLAGIVFGSSNRAKAEEHFNEFGYPAGTFMPIMVTEIICVVLYVIPQTAVLGAILLTGYLGGATATHVHAGQHNFFVPVIVGIVVWLGLFLRDHRVRALVPLRRPL